MAKRTIEIDIMKKIEEYIKAISKEFDIKEVYVFGSYAKGTNNENSDIDIAVVLDSDIDVIDLMVELMMFTKNIDLRIEPHPFKLNDFEKGNPFVDEIKSTGLKVA